jgi:UDP-N-acetylglucosamine--dolichyl-phosphate N-acetylglucosaminephosphotransferase
MVILASAYFLSASPLLLLVMVSTTLFAAYGILDDIMRLGKYAKLLLSMLIGISLLAFAGPPAVLFLPLLLLVAGVGNAFNLFAGFNGLEVGCSTLTAFFFSMACLVTGNLVPFYLSFGMFMILFSFLLHNKYPARIFPGNIGTFTIGGFFVGIALYYNLLHLLVPLLSLHAADMLIKGYSSGYFSSSEKANTKVNGKNILVPRSDYLSLVRLVLKHRPMTEKQLVSFFWALSIVIGVSTVAVAGVLL